MASPIKPNSFVDIFAKPENEINQNLEKGYLSRREVTELLDHLDKNTKIAIEPDGNNGFKWKIGSMTIDPSQKTNNTPFWMRRISHWFKFTFSEKYRDKFNDKIDKVHEAYDKFKLDSASAQQQATAQATALAEAQALEQLRTDISSKEGEITPVQTALDQMNRELEPLTTGQQQLQANLTEANRKIQEFTTNHTNLTILHNNLEGYRAKGFYLEEADKPTVEALEMALFGEIRHNKLTELGLRSSENRSAALERLSAQKEAQEELKAGIETDLATCSASILEKTPARDLKQTELNTLLGELQVLKGRLPPVVDVDPIVVADGDIAVDAQPRKTGIQALLAGKTDIDKDKINEAQDIRNNPLINKKALFLKIANRETDDFYAKTVEPGLKLMASVLAAKPEDAERMFNTWKAGLEECADKWIAAGSSEQDIDSLTTFDTLFENIMKANDALDFLAKSNLNVTEFFAHLSALEIPEKMKFAFAVSDAEAEQILDAYLENPADTDLSPLFADDTKFHSWPRDCQFFLAVSMLTVRLDNTNLISDVQARADRLAVIVEAEKIEEPGWLGVVSLLMKSRFFFNIGLGSITSKLPAIEPEATRLAESHTALKIASPTGDLPAEDEAKYQAAYVFAQNPDRMAFDQAYIKFTTELRNDAINAMVAKHKAGGEIDLYNVANGAFGLRGPVSDVSTAQKGLIKTLNSGSSQATKNKKREELEKTQAALLIGTLNFVQSLSAFAVNNPTLAKLTTDLDRKVMVSMREQGALNLETTPFIPWFQDTVLKPITETEAV